MDLIGFGFASAALILFGLYMVPRKLTRLRDLPFVLSMCLGVVVSTTAASLLMHGVPLLSADPHSELLAFLCGPVWYLGVLFYTISVTRMGLTLATPIKNTTAVLGNLIGLVYFAEYRETHPLPAVVGSLLVVVSAWIISRTSENHERRSTLSAAGVGAALAAAVFFASYTIPFRIAQRAGLDTVTLVAYMGLGTLAGAVVAFALLDRDWRGWLRLPLAAGWLDSCTEPLACCTVMCRDTLLPLAPSCLSSKGAAMAAPSRPAERCNSSGSRTAAAANAASNMAAPGRMLRPLTMCCNR